MENAFLEAYKKLNDKQRQAVDQTDGPVLVVAGPGTGKTQLLSMRVANILLQDSTLLPTNILCLTFTEAGQTAMQRRLIQIMGEAGAHVAVHTFHSFGVEIINSYPRYFYNGADYSPADELTTHEIIQSILEKLPHGNPLAAQNQGEFVQIKHIKRRIQELKKAAVTPDELRRMAEDGLRFVTFLEPLLFEVFDVPVFRSSADISRAEKLADEAAKFRQIELKVQGFKPLSEVFAETFNEAFQRSNSSGQAKALNEWKKTWFGRDKDKQAICKQRELLEKLLELADVYEKYTAELDNRRLYDFDDMIVQVVHALENRGDLAYELQEQYQYFLVDEFQDTNAGQLRLLKALANHPVNEGNPNVMVVGDDDQAIYAFQGAELSNILGFKESYPDAKLINLKENYRSGPQILNSARELITQGEDRLENRYQELDKTLQASGEIAYANLERRLLPTQAQEYEWIVTEIGKLLKTGQSPEQVAVICREHKYLEQIIPYFFRAKIPISYERREDALQNPRIKELITLAKTVCLLSEGNHEAANGLMPELLSADYWQVPAADIWKLSLAAWKSYKENRHETFWLEIMSEGKLGRKLHNIAEFLFEAARLAQNENVETVLDFLVGNEDIYINEEAAEIEKEIKNSHFKILSPYKDFYFSEEVLNQNPETFVSLLSALTAIRNHLRRYRPDQTLKLPDFVKFCDLCAQASVRINVRELHAAGEKAVQLLTAHGCKGLEFETVFILSANQNIWASKNKGGGIALAPNMSAIDHNHNTDDDLRLFYVAMTRAKANLFVSGYQSNETGKRELGFAALENQALRESLPPIESHETGESTKLEMAEKLWHDVHYDLPQASMKELLAYRLENYKLSATHMNNFLDVTNGGPHNFLLGNLLQFPSAMSPSAAYGSAMHSTLEHLHHYVATNKKLLKVSELTEYFKSSLSLKRLSADDFNKYSDRGIKALETFIAQRSGQINPQQLSEQDFYSQGITLDGARLTGKLDLLEINDIEARVADYKTGGALTNWQGNGSSAYDKVKLHKYRQQLYFYKLLVDHSRTWGDKGVRVKSGELVFVEPDKQGQIVSLPLELTDTKELDRLVSLIKAIWQHITKLDFPHTSQYPPNIKGIEQFEQDLLDGKV